MSSARKSDQRDVSTETQKSESSNTERSCNCAPNVAHLNAEFPKYPITVEDKGWIYGVWYCSRSFQKNKLYGQYPQTFLKRALALFPDATNILHCPSGTVQGVRGTSVDKIRDAARCPQIVADACALPFPNDSFDLILSDPPYSDRDAQEYGTGHFPLKKAMQEFHRVLRPQAYFGLLHVMTPAFSKKTWKWVGMIGVLTGTNSRMRIFSIFECVKNASLDPATPFTAT